MNDEVKPHIWLGLDFPRPIADLASELQLNSEYVLEICKEAIDYHFRNFGTKAFYLEYSSQKGFLLRASSSVGSISTQRVQISIRPKIPNVRIEKILALSQRVGNDDLKIQNQQVLASMDADADYGLIELLGFSLVDHVKAIVRNGLFREFTDVLEDSSRVSSGPDVNGNISRGFLPPLVVGQTRENYDVLPNRVLKTALQLILHSNVTPLKSMVVGLMSHFETVTPLSTFEEKPLDVDASFGVPRADYVGALPIALAMVSNQGLDLDGNFAQIPSFVVDMDVVFEKYCGALIRELLDEAHFKVELQTSFPHSSTPPLEGRTWVPDIVVTDKSSGKKIVIDTKNKYSRLGDDGKPTVANGDIFQQYYYARSLNAMSVIVMYPGVKPAWVFPMQNAGVSKSDLVSKQTTALLSEALPKIVLSHEVGSLDFYQLQVELGGSLKATNESIAGICFFIRYLLRGL